MSIEGEPAPDRRRLWLLIGGIVLLAVVVAITVFALTRAPGGDEPRPTLTSESPTPTPTASETATPTPTPTATADPGPQPPSAETREHFRDALQSGNTAALEQNLADPVNVIYAATECCGPQTPAEAIASLSYVNPGGGATWDFDLDEATLAGWRAAFYADFFPVDAIVGSSSDGYTASFVPGPDGRIVTILLAFTDVLSHT